MPADLPFPRKKTAWILVAIILAGIALRFGGLGAESLWTDEYGTFLIVQASSWNEMFGIIDEQPVQPPFFALTRIWLMAAGTSPEALRAPSVLFGSLAPLLMFWLARLLFPQRPVTAFLAAALMAFSPMHLWYSQEARPYAMAITLGLGALTALALAWRRAERGRPRHSALALGAGAALGVAAVETHCYAVFPLCIFCAGAAFGVWRGPLKSLRIWGPALGLLALGAIHPALGILERMKHRQGLTWLPEQYDFDVWLDVLAAQWLGASGPAWPLGRCSPSWDSYASSNSAARIRWRPS